MTSHLDNTEFQGGRWWWGSAMIIGVVRIIKKREWWMPTAELRENVTVPSTKQTILISQRQTHMLQCPSLLVVLGSQVQSDAPYWHNVGYPARKSSTFWIIWWIWDSLGVAVAMVTEDWDELSGGLWRGENTTWAAVGFCSCFGSVLDFPRQTLLSGGLYT